MSEPSSWPAVVDRVLGVLSLVCRPTPGDLTMYNSNWVSHYPGRSFGARLLLVCGLVACEFVEFVQALVDLRTIYKNLGVQRARHADAGQRNAHNLECALPPCGLGLPVWGNPRDNAPGTCSPTESSTSNPFSRNPTPGTHQTPPANPTAVKNKLESRPIITADAAGYARDTSWKR
jgi:hypothetical protein